jgi:hypothetical protein
MQVRLRRTGGFAGVTLDSGPVDAAELEPAHADALAALEQEPPPAPARYRFTYELTFGSRSVRLGERLPTPELRAAIKALERRARGG